MSKSGIDLLNAGSCKGKTLEYKGKWSGFDLLVSLKHLPDAPELFMLSIKSPFFNIDKELIKKDVLDELVKVLNFLEYKKDV